MHHSFYEFGHYLWKRLENLQLNTTAVYNRLQTILFEQLLRERNNTRQYPMDWRLDSSFTGLPKLSEGSFARGQGPTPVQRSKVAEVVIDWLNTPQNRHWLLIFDNVDDIESFDIREFFPNASKGNILVTSRRREAARYGLGIPTYQ